jgi:hypothetical protein
MSCLINGVTSLAKLVLTLLRLTGEMLQVSGEEENPTGQIHLLGPGHKPAPLSWTPPGLDAFSIVNPGAAFI